MRELDRLEVPGRMAERRLTQRLAASRSRRARRWVIGAFALVTLVGCASGSPASHLVTGTEWKKGRVRQVALDKVDGLPVHPARASSAELSPGPHSVDVRVGWSNGREDTTQLHFEVESQKRYVALAYELEPGQARENARVRPYTFPESVGRDAARAALEGAAPLWAPVVLIYRGTKRLFGASEPATRPGEGCCFVWIQEEAGGALVAGERP